ncbi:MAG: hypothetical protein ABI629_04620 [bacterium]
MRGTAWLLAVSACVAVLAVAGVRIDRAAQAVSEDDQPVYLPQARYLQPLALGWRNALADVLWFRTISYFGAHFRSNRTYPWLASMCELVTDLDPRAFHVYRFAGVILPWEANQADAGIRLLEKGLRQFPDSWLLHYYLGFNAFFFKNDNATAVEQLRLAIAQPDVHPAIARLAAVLSAHHYGPEATVGFLQQMQRDVDSNEVRDVIAAQIQEAQLTADLGVLDDAAAAYRARSGRAPESPAALVDAGLLASVPSDPFGGQYEFDAGSGAARSSSGHQPSKLHQSKIREDILHGDGVGE